MAQRREMDRHIFSLLPSRDRSEDRLVHRTSA
jgi:hypothetical protein